MEKKQESVFMQMHNGTRTNEGSFNVALRDIFYKADQPNRHKLVAAFPEFFGEEVPEFGITKDRPMGGHRGIEMSPTFDKLKKSAECLFQAEAAMIASGSGGFTEDNLQEGSFEWTHLPRLCHSLSRREQRQSPPSNEPCNQLALLRDTISQTTFPHGVSLIGLCVQETGCSPDNKVCFALSGEVALDEFGNDLAGHKDNC